MTATPRTDRSARQPLLSLSLDPEGPLPLHRQLYQQLREAILGRRLTSGMRLPSSRLLTQELGISRNTVLAALDQLTAEGYLAPRRGSGSFVAALAPEPALPARQPTPRPEKAATLKPSGRSRQLAVSAPQRLVTGGAFTPGLADHREFPFALWSRLLAKSWRDPPAALVGPGEAQGHQGLRRAIARYLGAMRGVVCAPEQVFIVNGARQAVDLAAHALIDHGDIACVEEPGWPGLRGTLAANGALLVPVPVDEFGMTVASGLRVRLIAVAPSHQYPLGVTMSLARRLELIQWAKRSDAWILEDDYDSEFRYGGRPLAALQGLDEEGRVVYVGTFSKVLFASLRLAYLVVPPELVDIVARVRPSLDDYPSAIAQPALAEFIDAGHFVAHIRRMRRRYQARQEILLDAAGRHLSGLLDIEPCAAGMHLVARLGRALAGRQDDRTLSGLAAASGITAPALSSYFHGPVGAQGLLLGYAPVAEDEIEPAVRRLAQALGAARQG